MKRRTIDDKQSIDYQFNLCALHEMEDVVPMTRSERYMLRNWVRSGHEIESNPWDSWKGPDTQPLWCEERKCYVKHDELLEL